MDKRKQFGSQSGSGAMPVARQVIDGLVEDLSRSGLFLRAPEVMARGSSAEIELDLPGEEPLHLAAEVVRVEDSPETAGWGCGSSVDERPPVAGELHHAPAPDPAR